MFDDAGYAVVDTSIGGPGGHLPPPLAPPKFLWPHQLYHNLMCFDHAVKTVHQQSNTNFICARIVIGLFICALSSRPQAIANRPCGTKMAPKHRNVNFIKYLRMHQITPFPNSRNKIQKMSWGGHGHSGRGTPPPHTHPHLRRLRNLTPATPFRKSWIRHWLHSRVVSMTWYICTRINPL